MTEIDPNPDTPFVQAGGYNFGRRVRQPGGRLLKSCVERAGDLTLPALTTPPCQCAVFNNWGRPNALWVHFSDFSLCPGSYGLVSGPRCGFLNDLLATEQYAVQGEGPFLATYYGDDAAYFDAATGEWITGGLVVIGGGGPAASGVGYSCVWNTDVLNNLDDPCGNGLRAWVQIGYDTVAGVFCQITLAGGATGGPGAISWDGWSPYFQWTGLSSLAPGSLDASGDGPNTIYLSNNFTNWFRWECNGAGCSFCGKPAYNYLCYSGTLITNSVGYSECVIVDGNGSPQTTAGAGLTLIPGGTNQVAPPCCCGGPSRDPPNKCLCLWLCLANTDPKSGCSAQFQICRDPNNPLSYSGAGNFLDGSGPVSAQSTWDAGAGDWQLNVSCLPAPLPFKKLPTFSEGAVSPSPGGAVPAAGCCPSGNFDVSLSCTPDFCALLPIGPFCECPDPWPKEVLVTLPAMSNQSTNICQCSRCDEYAGTYILGYQGYGIGRTCSVSAGCGTYQGHYWRAWINAPCYRPDDKAVCDTVACKYWGGDTTNCPSCQPQGEQCAGGFTINICNNSYIRDCEPPASLLEFWIDCNNGPLVQLTSFFGKCAAGGCDDVNLGFGGMVQWILAPWGGFDLANGAKCCPQIQFELSQVDFDPQGGLDQQYFPCIANGTSVTVEAICD